MPTSAPDETSTMLTPGVEDAVTVDASYRVTVVDGPDRGSELLLDGTSASRVLVGQSPACALRVSDRQVSRRHFSLDVTSRGLRLDDLGSTNGTTVDGLRVGEAYLQGGEVIRVGTTTIQVSRVTSEPVTLTNAMRFGRLLGASPEMRRLYPLCERLAASDIPVLIEGETGTGKEVLAEAIHEASPRAGAPFVVFDCTTVPPALMESTLFGHERGAFTGAVAQRRGVFEDAHGGTLFIDEIGELEAAVQPRLLRALERAEVQRVGTNQWIKVDVRIVCATRRDLDAEVQAGRFRDDLFFRLAVGRVELPPLRTRSGDIGLLTRHFWRTLGGDDQRPLPSDLLKRFEGYPWPGNVRELQNAVARYLALGELTSSDTATALEALPQPVLGDASGGEVIDRVLAQRLPLPRARDLVVAEFERRYVKDVLERYSGNVGRAAVASGIARRYFQILRARRTKDEG